MQNVSDNRFIIRHRRSAITARRTSRKECLAEEKDAASYRFPARGKTPSASSDGCTLWTELSAAKTGSWQQFRGFSATESPRTRGSLKNTWSQDFRRERSFPLPPKTRFCSRSNRPSVPFLKSSDSEAAMKPARRKGKEVEGSRICGISVDTAHAMPPSGRRRTPSPTPP
ncbi:MAG: hypothetical protein E6254_03525 [Eggerthella sp.]|nr:hypothetical protein [Eggerthella sp.]